MATKTHPIPTFRKTKSDEWVVLGVPALVKANLDVVVRKANGDTKQVSIAHVGKPFDVNGVRMVYGYMGEAQDRTPIRDLRYARHACRTAGNCSSFGTGASCGGHDCDGW